MTGTPSSGAPTRPTAPGRGARLFTILASPAARLPLAALGALFLRQGVEPVEHLPPEDVAEEIGEDRVERGLADNSLLAYGRDLARTFGGVLHILHVADNVGARFSADISLVDLPDLQRDIDASARRQLAAVREVLAG